MDIGSWDTEGKCSELGGGVHQICVKNISNNTKIFQKKQDNQTGLHKEIMIITVCV